MKKILTSDAITIVLSSGPVTISSTSPLFFNLKEAATEDEVNCLLAIKYSTVYIAYKTPNNELQIVTSGTLEAEHKRHELLGYYLSEQDAKRDNAELLI